MNRTRVQALVLVNWKGVFYQRFLIDPNVTALEGANGAGKTTVMIAAYIVFLPDLSRLRFTNLGETGATGGDRGIWGRLGDLGRPSYSIIEFSISSGQRFIAGVHLERQGEPSLELTPFIISDLSADVRLQDVFLLAQGGNNAVPELNELRENAARFGGRMEAFNTARDYFSALFDYSVMPMRLSNEEERKKLNELLRTSMTGGISRALTSELRSFLLKEESGLADTLRRIKDNLAACKRTRIEVQESRRLEKEIGGVFEAGRDMFAAAFRATQERAEELRRRLSEAEETKRKAKQNLGYAEEQLARTRDDLTNRNVRKQELDEKVKTAEGWLQRLEKAFAASQEVSSWRDKLSSATESTENASKVCSIQKKERMQCRDALRRCEENYKRAANGLADLQQGLDELHRRAGMYRKVIRRLDDAKRHLGADVLTISSLPGQINIANARLETLDRERREVKTRLADASGHKREYEIGLAALERLTGGIVEPSEAQQVAHGEIRKFQILRDLVGRKEKISQDLVEAGKLAGRQGDARKLAEKLELSFTGKQPADLEVRLRLEKLEEEREEFLMKERDAQNGVTECQRNLENLRGKEKEYTERESTWRDLMSRAERLTEELNLSVTTFDELQAVRKFVTECLAQIKTKRSFLIEKREGLQSEARNLLSTKGPFDSELMRLKDVLGAEMLASAFEDTPLEDAAELEAKLGPLVQALVVDDPENAAKQIHGRSRSLPEVWIVSRDEDAEQLVIELDSQKSSTTDVVVEEQRGFRVTQIPTHARLGSKARNKRAAELRAESDALQQDLETLLTEQSRFKRFLEDGEMLFANQVVWLGGDPSPELARICLKLAETDAQHEKFRTDSSDFRKAAAELVPRIQALQSLLGLAVLLDPPDYGHRRATLKSEYDEAIAAQRTVSQFEGAFQTVEEKLTQLRRLPLSQDEISELEMELRRLTDERDRQDDAIEAMDFVVSYSDALDWGDAPKLLTEKEALVPALKRQLSQAEDARVKAEESVETAEECFELATSKWQDADGHRRVMLRQLKHAEQLLAQMEIPEPTEEAVETASAEVQRLKDVVKKISTELDNLKFQEGRCASDRDQAVQRFEEAKNKVDSERSAATPTIERWENLQSRVVELGLKTPELFSNDRGIDKIRGHANLVQEANLQLTLLGERLNAAGEMESEITGATKNPESTDLGFGDSFLNHWLLVRKWLLRRLPAEFAELEDPREGLQRLRDQLAGLEERLVRQEEDLRGDSTDVAIRIEVDVRKARGRISRLNRNLEGVSFGSIELIRVKAEPVERMEQVLRALREGAVQKLLFQEDLPIEVALDEIFQRFGGGRSGGQRLLDYREYIHLQVEVRRKSKLNWELARPTSLSTGEAIGVGAALMMVVLTEWERDAKLLRKSSKHGSTRFLFLDEANRLSYDNLGVLFELCQNLELQLLIAAPEVARADGNTTYCLVRQYDSEGREDVLVSGRRTRVET